MPQSKSLYISSNITGVALGDVIRLDGEVVSCRASAQHLHLTDVIDPTNVRTLSTDSRVTLLVLGSTNALSPATEQYTSLDDGSTLNSPNNSSLISTANPVLEPSKYGLHFWKSIIGELAIVRNPTEV